MALVDYFLKIDGISGESTDDKHRGEIEVASFSWGVTQTSTRATGGAGAGKATFQDFHFTKLSDKASPTLFQKCATGAHIKHAVLTARKAGENQQEFLKITLSDLLVSSYQSGGTATPTFIEISTPSDVAFLSQNLVIGDGLSSGFGDPMDQAALRYAKLDFVEGTPRQISVSPTGAGTLTFDAKTQQVTVGDWNGDGITIVGKAGGNTTRAVQEFDVKVLIGLLTAPFNTGRLGLMVNEVRGQAITPGDLEVATFSTQTLTTGDTPRGPRPPRFDVILYTNADGSVTVEDLTRPGKRIGQLVVDPSGDPASLDLDLGPILLKHDTTAFGIRLQLHGDGIAEPGENEDEGPEERSSAANVSAAFTMALVFDTTT